MTQLGGFRYWIDKELKRIHLFQDCTMGKMARKYSYMDTVHIDTVEQARILDGKGRACQTCFKREQMLARRDNRRPRPGFLMDPGA